MSIIAKPYTFSPNTTISSSQANSNFDTLFNDYNGGITAANLATDSVTTAKIADLNVTAAKLGSSAVTAVKVAAGAITPDKLALSPAFARVDTSETETNTSYDDMTTPGPAVTVTIGANGLALVCTGALMDMSTSAFGYMSFAVSGTNTVAAADNNACLQFNTNDRVVSRTILLTGLTPGSTTFTCKYKVASGTMTCSFRTIAVIPL